MDYLVILFKTNRRVFDIFIFIASNVGKGLRQTRRKKQNTGFHKSGLKNKPVYKISLARMASIQSKVKYRQTIDYKTNKNTRILPFESKSLDYQIRISQNLKNKHRIESKTQRHKTLAKTWRRSTKNFKHLDANLGDFLKYQGDCDADYAADLNAKFKTDRNQYEKETVDKQKLRSLYAEL